jgi:single-strand DNA-binding protein
MQKLTVTGRLGKDPEMNFLTDGRPITKTSIAVRTWSKATGEITNWYDVIAFDRAAEYINKLGQKGTVSTVTGDFFIRKYTGKRKDGSEYSGVAYEIVLNEKSGFEAQWFWRKEDEVAPDVPDAPETASDAALAYGSADSPF